MKKNIIFILSLGLIIIILCIIYYNGDDTKEKSLKNNLIKIGYN